MQTIHAPYPKQSAEATERRLLERDQSLERLRYLEDIIQRATREELSYAIKLLALVLVDLEGDAIYLNQKPNETDMIYGLVLHASIALEKAKKGVDPTTQLLNLIEAREMKEQVLDNAPTA